MVSPNEARDQPSIMYGVPGTHSYMDEQNVGAIPITIDPPDTAEVEKSRTLLASMELGGIPLRTALRLVLAQFGMEFSINKGILIINRPKEMGGMVGGMQRMGSGMMGGTTGTERGTGQAAKDTGKKAKQSTKSTKKTVRGGGI